MIKFGTDGWRAVMAEEFTFPAVELVSQAYASLLKSQSRGERPSVCIGYDRRFLSADFAERTARVLMANDIDVELFPEPVPTPLVSFTTAQRKLSGGIVITASHNPPEYNGFKIKEPSGTSAFESTTRAVEELLDAPPAVHADAGGTPALHGTGGRKPGDGTDLCTGGRPPAVRMPNQTPAASATNASVPEPPASVWTDYLHHLAGLVDIERIRAAGIHAIVDSMHGTGGTIIEEMLRGGKTQITTIRSNRDCLFGGISPEPIDKNLGPLKTTVTETRATIGIATDGDADRLGAVNEHGQTMTMHEVAPLLLYHLVKHRGLTGSVVATVTQSTLLKHMADAYGLPFIETPVGFKYIASEILSGDVLIGAEESGGIGIQGHIPERDGILNGLLLLEAIAVSGKSPTQLIAVIQDEFGEYCYERVDVRIDAHRAANFMEDLATKTPSRIADTRVVGCNTTDGVKLLLADHSWLMFRLSGTEPVLRLYAEASSGHAARKLLDEGAKMFASKELVVSNV